ncbi:uncharacterized protein LOC122851211 isoform X2 [Aphidius gifuensis]|uniref:uncharacterized protein LOC122851211 isoform X2 n=1 Tax=Aphidius gifuensis TaxID=684658 RepID=UPI001CDBFAAE|nr:uncharacterized protein LOC122851211 isoform X2 [Aphidius gifuensis]
METTSLLIYNKNSGGYLTRLIWNILLADGELRAFFNLGRNCSFVTIFMIGLIIIMAACTFMSTKIANSNEFHSRSLQNEANEKLPRRQSILRVRPAYNCIHKHQTEVFQEKTKQTLHKEHLEIELMKSRIACMNKLLRS